MQTAEAAGCAEKGEQAGWWSQAAVYAALLDVGVVFVAFWSISRLERESQAWYGEGWFHCLDFGLRAPHLSPLGHAWALRITLCYQRDPV
jgi:hypothetical protein